MRVFALTLSTPLTSRCQGIAQVKYWRGGKLGDYSVNPVLAFAWSFNCTFAFSAQTERVCEQGLQRVGPE